MRKFTYNCLCGQKSKRNDVKKTIHNDVLYLACTKCNLVIETQTKDERNVVTILNLSDRKVHINKYMEN